MDNKGITFADVSRSLNRLDGFIDDFLLTVQSYNEKRIIEKANVIVDSHKETMVIYPIDIKKSIIGFIDEVKFNRDGDESINYYGIHDCVDYILNNQSLLLVKRAFSIETKIKEAEPILLSFLSEIEETSELLWQTGQILWEIGELHIEPFIQETSHIENNPIPETGDNEDVGNGEKTKADNKPKTKDDIIKSLEGKEQFVPSKPINLYDVFYDRLVKGKIKNKNDEYHVLGVLRKICDDDKENVELFKRCVESADISNLYNEGKKSYARLFMNDIASLFSEPEKFRKAAAKSFGLKEGTELGAVGGNYKKDYRSLMNGLFDDNADYRNRNNS